MLSVSAERLWNEYNRALGNTLNSTFAWFPSLELAKKEQEANNDFLGPSQPLLKLDCTSYNAGEKLAFEYRNGEFRKEIKLIPYLVDEAENNMCFLEVSPLKSNDTIDTEMIQQPFLDPTKVHESVHLLIESLIQNSNYDSISQILYVSFRQEIFDVNQDDPSNEVESYLKAWIERSTAQITLNKFFWTKPSVWQYFQDNRINWGHDNSFVTDFNRLKQWKLIRDSIFSYSNDDQQNYSRTDVAHENEDKENSSDTASKVSDVVCNCKFEEVAKAMAYQPVTSQF